MRCYGINFRFYPHRYFAYRWRSVKPVTLVGYAFLRPETDLAGAPSDAAPTFAIRHFRRLVLHVLDWIPVRLAGVVYALLGHGEKALPARLPSLADFLLHTSQYQVPHTFGAVHWRVNRITDKVETPKAAVVSMAKKARLWWW